MRALAALIASIWLPAGGTFWSVQPAGSFLRLTGSAEAGTDCIYSSVTLSSFELRGTSIGACRRDPGHQVTWRVVYDPHSPWQGIVLSTGKVVFTYEDASDTRPASAYGGGYLWIYDVWTQNGAQLAQVSASTGRVVRTIAMPQVFRPLMAADDDGVWLVPATNGGVQYGQAPVLHVPPAGKPSIVHLEGRAALWIYARDHTVWTEIVADTSSAPSLWRFDGAKARATRLSAPADIHPNGVTWGDGKLWTVVVSRDGRSGRVMTIDPATGSFSTVATVPELDQLDPLAFDPQGLTFARGALYYLDSPKLYRISARG